MKSLFPWAGVLLYAILIARMVFPPAATALQLGDPAPALAVGTWVQGPPVRLATGQEKRIHVVEFWEPDCPHCRESVPLLNMLWETYTGQGVVVAGISSESAESVRAFLASAEEPVRYRVGVDAENRSGAAYMDGFGIDGVPHAFVVDRQGRIAWEGHPMDGLDEAVAQMVAGRYDLDRRIRSNTAEKLMDAYLYLARHTRETDLLRQMGERITALAWDDARLLGRLAGTIASEKEMNAPGLALALLSVERAQQLDPGSNAGLATVKSDLLLKLGRARNGSPKAVKKRR